MSVRVEELVGANIKAARERVGMNQPQLGEWLAPFLGKPLPRQAIHAAERGQRQFSAAELMAFALVLSVEVADLFRLPLDVEAVEMPSGKSLARSEVESRTRMVFANELDIERIRLTFAELERSAQGLRDHGTTAVDVIRDVHRRLEEEVRLLVRLDGES
jgi:hypothetical protein